MTVKVLEGHPWVISATPEGRLCARQGDMSCHFLLRESTSVSRPCFVCVLLPVHVLEQLLVICRVDSN